MENRFLPSSKGSLDKTLQRASSAYPVISESLLKRTNQDVSYWNYKTLHVQISFGVYL